MTTPSMDPAFRFGLDNRSGTIRCCGKPRGCTADITTCAYWRKREAITAGLDPAPSPKDERDALGVCYWCGGTFTDPPSATCEYSRHLDAYQRSTR